MCGLLQRAGILHTVKVVVTGTPTVRVMTRWAEIWRPWRTIFHVPEAIAE